MSSSRLTFVEHIYELRRRLTYVALTAIFFGTVAYFFQQQLVAFLLAPSHGQQFIYTSPGGGINFLFQICTYVGIFMSIPVIVYQLFNFIEPVIKSGAKKFIVHGSIFSGCLAIIGLCFGYFIGLPAALHFLSNQFVSQQIKPLFTLQEYMSFVTIYLVGSALLFQIPLIMLLINRIKPLKPKKLLGIERYVIVLAFIAAAIITPTPDIINQLIIAVPIIAIYQFGIVLVWFHNRSKKADRLAVLLEKDRQVQAERLQWHQLSQVPLSTSTPPLASSVPIQARGSSQLVETPRVGRRIRYLDIISPQPIEDPVE